MKRARRCKMNPNKKLKFVISIQNTLNNFELRFKTRKKHLSKIMLRHSQLKVGTRLIMFKWDKFKHVLLWTLCETTKWNCLLYNLSNFLWNPCTLFCFWYCQNNNPWQACVHNFSEISGQCSKSYLT
jgi:hypothetical protein